MSNLGNHVKLNVPKRLHAETRAFYLDALECELLESPYEDLELYRFENGGVIGVFFCWDEAETLSPQEQFKSAWLEIKSAEPERLKHKLIELGLQEIDYVDTSRFYFHAPGGQVFRLAPLDGGI